MIGYKYGASGDFAEAYVLAHELGHHVQNLLGILNKAQNLNTQQRVREMRIEFQVQLSSPQPVSCSLANRQREDLIFEEGDIEEALNTASAIGDDTLPREPKGMSSQIA